MRLSNRNKAGFYNFINTVLVMLLIVGIVVFFIERNRLDFLGYESYLLIIVPILIILLYYLAGRQIFEYDSDGEALNFKNRNVLPFLQKASNDEFPKYKLLKYEIVNFLGYKGLFITISSKKTTTVTLKYDITFLRDKEIKDLRQSLNKVVKENKEKRRN